MKRIKSGLVLLALLSLPAGSARAFVFVDPTNLIQNTISAIEAVQTTLYTIRQYKQMILEWERYLINMTGIPQAIRTFRSGTSLLGEVEGVLDADAFWNQVMGEAWSSLYYPTPDRDAVHTRYSHVVDPQTVRQMESYYRPYQDWQADQQKVMEQYGDTREAIHDYLDKSDEISGQLAALPDQESELATLQTAAAANALTAQGIGAMRQDLNRLVWETNKHTRLEEAQRMESLKRDFDDREELRRTDIGYIDPKQLNVY